MKNPTTPYEALLLASAIEILKSDPRKDESRVNALRRGLTAQAAHVVIKVLDF